MKFSSILTFIFLFSYNLDAQNRSENPIQIHLNGSGLFLKAFANSLADSEIDELIIKKWAIPGLSFGFHLNNKFYIGYSFQPNRNLILREPWTFGNGENDGNISVNHNSGNFHSIEGRYFPFKFDLYGSLFLTHVSKAKYSMNFNRIENTMKLGMHSYMTDIEAEWNFKALNTLGIGIGYNYVHKNGFSFDLGIGIPIPLSEPFHENIEIKSTSGIIIEQNDIELGKEKIENEIFYFPIQFHFNIGYNLKYKKK